MTEARLICSWMRRRFSSAGKYYVAIPSPEQSEWARDLMFPKSSDSRKHKIVFSVLHKQPTPSTRCTQENRQTSLARTAN
jgi:hypothetical protein